MAVSRQTFGNIIDSAHAKLADFVVNGRMLRIEGGAVMVQGERVFVCMDCGAEWRAPHGTGRPQACPACGGSNFHRSPRDRGPRRVGAAARRRGRL